MATKKNITSIPQGIQDRITLLIPWLRGYAPVGTVTARTVLLHALEIGLREMEVCHRHGLPLPMPETVPESEPETETEGEPDER